MSCYVSVGLVPRTDLVIGVLMMPIVVCVIFYSAELIGTGDNVEPDIIIDGTVFLTCMSYFQSQFL